MTETRSAASDDASSAPLGNLIPAGTPQTLRTLKELELPASVSYTPQTVGWIGIGALLAIVLLWVGWRALRHYHAQRYRRVALLELTTIEARLAVSTQRASALAQLARVLKRVSLVAAPHDRVASLSGEAWIAFLNRTRGRFDARSASLLSLGSYAPAEYIGGASEADIAQLVVHARDWIRHHHVEV